MLERIGGSRASIKTVVGWHPRFDVTRIVRLRRLPESTPAESERWRRWECPVFCGERTRVRSSQLPPVPTTVNYFECTLNLVDAKRFV